MQRVKWLRYSAVKLFSQNSNLYDYDTSTLQTDGRTDNLPLQYHTAYHRTVKNSKSHYSSYCDIQSGIAYARGRARPRKGQRFQKLRPSCMLLMQFCFWRWAIIDLGLPDFQSQNTGDFCTRFRVPNGHERCSCCCSCSTFWGSCCYRVFLSLRLCRFSTDRNQTFLHISMKICCINLPCEFLDLGHN